MTPASHEEQLRAAPRTTPVREVLYRILRLSLEPLELRILLERALEILFRVEWLGLAPRGAVLLREEGGSELVLAAERGLPDGARRTCGRVPIGSCLCGQAALHRTVIFKRCVDAEHSIRYGGIEPHGHYAVPILDGDELLGVVNLYVAGGHERSREEEELLLSVAQVLAGIIRRRRTESALRRSEERFQLALRATDAGIWDWDVTSDEVYFSPRWKSMLGYAPGEIADDFREWESRLHPDDRPRAQAALRAYFRGETQEYEFEHRLRHRDGSWRRIVARGVAVRDEQGRPVRMVGSHLDVTKRHEAERMVRENELQLRTAERIQRHLLPRAPPRFAPYDIAGLLEPADFAGGDAFDYLPRSEDTLDVVVSDVSGHGLGPALLMASTHTLLRLLARTPSTLDAIALQANAFLYEETLSDQFVSMLLLELDRRTGVVSYVNAGHPAAYVMDRDGRLKARLERTGPLLSIDRAASFPLGTSVQLEPGDVLLLLTDGVLEAHDREGEEFGEERLLDVLRRTRREPAAAITQAIYDEVLTFRGQPRLEDDVTLVAIQDTR